jgi:hypothetical protein
MCNNVTRASVFPIVTLILKLIKSYNRDAAGFDVYQQNIVISIEYFYW